MADERETSGRTVYRIRPIAESDEPFLWQMLYEAIHAPPDSPRPPRAIVGRPELVRYAAGWGREGDLGLLALALPSEARLGAAWLRCFPQDAPGYGFVGEGIPELTMALVPAARGQGIGTALLHQLLRLAAGRYPALSLSVAPDNPARRLYERVGFRPVGQAGDSLTMRLDLRSTPPRGAAQ